MSIGDSLAPDFSDDRGEIYWRNIVHSQAAELVRLRARLVDAERQLKQCSTELTEAANVIRPQFPSLASIFDQAALAAAKGAREGRDGVD